MKRSAPRRISYANVTSTLALVVALVVALGGTSYAAVTITGKNIKNDSITSADLAKGAVATEEVKNGSLRKADFRNGELPAGPAGATGATGAAGAAGAPGASGPQGPAGPLPDVLPSGKTLRGYYLVSAKGAGIYEVGLSFAFPLAATPTGHVLVLGVGTPDPAHNCPGSAEDPEAAPGHLCVYESDKDLLATGTTNLDVVESRFGFTVSFLASNPGYTSGTWAVTAR